jgi:hypothetical protein
MQELTTTQAVEQLEQARKEGRVLRFACTNPHWWIGVDEKGKFWWRYYCCDYCEQEDYETFTLSQNLLEHADSGSGFTWIPY